MRDRVVHAYRDYDFRAAHTLLYDFCNDTLSAVYLDAVKDRLYCDRADAPRRRLTQATIHQIAGTLITLLAPILPHTGDEAWRDFTGDEDACVQLQTFGGLDAEADAAWPRVIEARDRVRKALEEAKDGGIENPLDAGVVVGDPNGTLVRFREDLVDLFGASRVTLTDDDAVVKVIDLRDEPRCERSWRRDETVKQRSDGGWLSDRDAEAVGLG